MVKGFERKVYGEGQELQSNFKEFQETSFYIGDPVKGVIRRYNISEVRGMRNRGETLIPISVDPEKRVDSVAEVPNSIVACGTCERLTDEEKNTVGIKRGITRVGFTDGEFVMLCKTHYDPLEIHLEEIEDIIGSKDTDEVPESLFDESKDNYASNVVARKKNSSDDSEKEYWWQKYY